MQKFTALYKYVVINKQRTLTIVEVNVLGDFVPCSVVEVAHLLLVLHHADWLGFLLVLEGNVVLNGFKILPVLKSERTDA